MTTPENHTIAAVAYLGGREVRVTCTCGKAFERGPRPHSRRQGASAWVRHNRHRVRLNNPHLSHRGQRVGA